MDDGSVIVLEGEFISKKNGEFSDWLDSKMNQFDSSILTRTIRTRKEKLKKQPDSLTPDEVILELRKENIKTIVAEVTATIEVTD